MSRVQIGRELDGLVDTIMRDLLAHVAEYRRTGFDETLRRGVDIPQRTRVRFTEWRDRYDARNGAGSAVTFLNGCLAAFGSADTVQSIANSVAALEQQAMSLVSHVQVDGWTLDQVATAIETNVLVADSVDFRYKNLPLPDGYMTVWGTPF